MRPCICNLLAIRMLICSCIMLPVIACSSRPSPVLETKEKFQVITPLIIDTVYTKEYVAEIQSVQNVELRARVTGFIEKIHVDEGQPVQAGQLLFTLGSREYEEELLKATSQMKNAQAELKGVVVELNSTGILVNQDIVSNSQLDLMKAKKEAIEARIEEAKSSIAIAKLNLSFTQVRAPFAGIINRIPNKTGSLVEEGKLLTTISNNKEIFAYFNVSEKEYLDFRKTNEGSRNAQVSLLLADNSLFNQKGIVETTEAEIDKSSGNIAFRARFANPQQLLKHGGSGKILLNTSLNNVMVVPQKSTFEVQDKLNVYVIDSNNVVMVKSFVPKLRLSNLYVVESGLTPNDKIVYEGIQLLKEGDKIQYEMIQSRQMLKH